QTPDFVAAGTVKCLRHPIPEVWPGFSARFVRFGMSVTTLMPRVGDFVIRGMVRKRIRNAERRAAQDAAAQQHPQSGHAAPLVRAASHPKTCDVPVPPPPRSDEEATDDMARHARNQRRNAEETRGGRVTGGGMRTLHGAAVSTLVTPV